MPKPRHSLVQRTNLIERLNTGINNKLTLISAPAGFGKTTFLSEWISQSKIPVAWISLDKGDSDPVFLIKYIIAALQTIESNIGKAALSILQSPQQPSIESIMMNLIQEITEISSNFVLVFDDYHSIDTEKTHKIVEYFIDNLPHQIHLVVSTRVDPPLPLPKLRVRNQLTEFRASDLCFTLEEASLFFNEIMSLGLSSKEISILESRTEGWIAGLKLAGLSMRSREDIPSFIKAFAGDDRHIVDYLAEEVLNVQPKHIQNFLLQTSILSRLSGPLCDFVTNQKDSQEILEELERANLFIVPLDNKRYWYRYHHLFADLLCQRLRQTQLERVPKLHRLASEWCEQNGATDEAIEYALQAGDLDRMAYLVEEQTDSIWARGEHAKFWHWLEQMPIDLVFSKPKLSVLHAESLLIRWQIEAAEKSLKVAEQELNHSTNRATEISLTERDQLSISDRMKMQGRIATNRALIASFREDVSGIIHHANQAIDCLPEEELSWRGAVAIVLGDAHSIKGDMVAAYRAQLEALEICKVSGHTFLFLIANANLAVTLRHQGRLQRTLEICQQHVQLADKSGLSQTVVVGWFLAIWGEALSELNDLEGAIDTVRKGVELAERCGDVGMLCESYLCLMRVLFSRGNLADAEEVIEKLENIVRESDVSTKIKSMIAAWQARIWLTQNKLKAASQWVEEHELVVNEEPAYLHEIEYIVLARILIAQGRSDEATGLLQRLQESAETGGRTTRVIEILILQALAFQVGGDTARVMAVLERALTLAKPEGYIRIFVDEGPSIEELLKKSLEAKLDVPRVYVKKLLSAFRVSKLITTDNGVVERLSERELEVLRLIAAGLSNKKIMEELFISLSTVKTHIRNIYSKLNVHSRTEAMVKAKDLNLL